MRGVVVVLLLIAVGTQAVRDFDDATGPAGLEMLPRFASADSSSSLSSSMSMGESSASMSMGSMGSMTAPAEAVGAPMSGSTGAIPDILNIQSANAPEGDLNGASSLPPYTSLNADAVTSPTRLTTAVVPQLSLELDRRIKQTEDLLNRMVWQLNRETSWANSVHDIIQNYQYKFTKVLFNIKKHSEATGKMRELVQTLKKARLHEVLETDLAKATAELQELAAGSSETSEDEGSYAALKERVSLLKQDLEKMAHTKVNKVLHNFQTQMKEAEGTAVPPSSTDTLTSLISNAGAPPAESSSSSSSSSSQSPRMSSSMSMSSSSSSSESSESGESSESSRSGSRSSSSGSSSGSSPGSLSSNSGNLGSSLSYLL